MQGLGIIHLCVPSVPISVWIGVPSLFVELLLNGANKNDILKEVINSRLLIWLWPVEDMKNCGE